MPNHITNIIKISSTDKNKLETIKNDISSEISFDFRLILPPPNNDAYNDKPTQKIAKKSSDWWYNWNCANWGTKWNAYSFNDNPISNYIKSMCNIIDTIGDFEYSENQQKIIELFKSGQEKNINIALELCKNISLPIPFDNLSSSIFYMFETAWSHPRPVIDELSRKYKDVNISVLYADEDIGSNFGHYQIINGEVLELGFDEWTLEQKDKFCCIVNNYDYQEFIEDF